MFVFFKVVDESDISRSVTSRPCKLKKRVFRNVVAVGTVLSEDSIRFFEEEILIGAVEGLSSKWKRQAATRWTMQ